MLNFYVVVHVNFLHFRGFEYLPFSEVLYFCSHVVKQCTLTAKQRIKKLGNFSPKQNIKFSFRQKKNVKNTETHLRPGVYQGLRDYIMLLILLKTSLIKKNKLHKGYSL